MGFVSDSEESGAESCLLDVLRREIAWGFTRTVTTAIQERRNVEGFDIKKVKAMGAKEFWGSADHAEAETWLTDVELVFEVLQCPDGDRVRLAAFLLKGNAYHWWKTEENQKLSKMVNFYSKDMQEQLKALDRPGKHAQGDPRFAKPESGLSKFK
ncbi:unnamed protein product [Prunus armeniaca]